MGKGEGSRRRRSVWGGRAARVPTVSAADGPRLAITIEAARIYIAAGWAAQHSRGKVGERIPAGPSHSGGERGSPQARATVGGEGIPAGQTHSIGQVSQISSRLGWFTWSNEMSFPPVIVVLVLDRQSDTSRLEICRNWGEDLTVSRSHAHCEVSCTACMYTCVVVLCGRHASASLSSNTTGADRNLAFRVCYSLIHCQQHTCTKCILCM